MTITAKYASICPCCNRSIAPGDKVEWSKGTKARHVACAGSSPSTVSRATTQRRTCCVGCGGHLDAFQQRRGFKFCSADCANDARLGGQSGWVNGAWHQGSDD